MVGFDGTYLQQLLSPAPASISKTFPLLGGAWSPMAADCGNALFEVADSTGAARDVTKVKHATDMLPVWIVWMGSMYINCFGQITKEHRKKHVKTFPCGVNFLRLYAPNVFNTFFNPGPSRLKTAFKAAVPLLGSLHEEDFGNSSSGDAISHS